MSDHPAGRKIYIVDDETLIAFTLEEILKNAGFDAKSFTKPLEALEAAKSATPDLLITDVVMPKMSGVELAIEFRTHYPGCQILLFSGQSRVADQLEKAREQGHNFAILAKPIHPRDLIAAITSL